MTNIFIHIYNWSELGVDFDKEIERRRLDNILSDEEIKEVNKELKKYVEYVSGGGNMEVIKLNDNSSDESGSNIKRTAYAVLLFFSYYFQTAVVCIYSQNIIL